MHDQETIAWFVICCAIVCGVLGGVIVYSVLEMTKGDCNKPRKRRRKAKKA